MNLYCSLICLVHRTELDLPMDKAWSVQGEWSYKWLLGEGHVASFHTKCCASPYRADMKMCLYCAFNFLHVGQWLWETIESSHLSAGLRISGLWGKY